METDEYAYIVDTLRRGQEKIKDLRRENEKFSEANERLVDLVKKLENLLVAEVGEDFDWESNRYNYPDRWTPTEVIHEKDLELNSDLDLEELDRQIQEAIKTMKRAEQFKTSD